MLSPPSMEREYTGGGTPIAADVAVKTNSIYKALHLREQKMRSRHLMDRMKVAMSPRFGCAAEC